MIMENKPSTMPNNWGGQISLGKKFLAISQLLTPTTIDTTAPWLVALDQYKPKTSGTKAAAKVIS